MIHTDFVLLSCLLCSILCFIHIMKWNRSISKALCSVLSQITNILLSTGLEGLQQIVFKAGLAFFAEVMTAFLYPSCLWQSVTSLLLTIRSTVSFQNPALFVTWPFEFHGEEPRIWATWKTMFCFYGDSFAFFPNSPGLLMGFYPLNSLEKCSV